MRSVALQDFGVELSPESPNPYRQPPFADVENGLSLIEADGPERLDTDSLREDVRWLSRLQRSVEAISARWLAELDRREQQGLFDPVQACSLWLQETLQVTPNAAYAQLRTARQLDQLPSTRNALRAGELSGQQVSVICRAMEQVPRTSMEPSDVETMLLDAARRMDPTELQRHWCQLRYQADQEAGLEAEEEQRQRSWLHLRQTRYGTFRLDGELDAEGGVMLRTALKAQMGHRARDDERTAEQRRAAALAGLAKFRLDSGTLPTRGGQKPHLTLVAELSTLRLEPGSRLAELDWGPLVTGETARRIACDAAITPVLVDAEGEILHVGRCTRTVPAPMRKALNLRDRHCQAEGCRVPAEDCTPHHRKHLADGGPTELWNLELLCDRHHSEAHPENARFRKGPSGAVQSRAP